MFILSWFVILIMRANDIVVPHLVSGLVGWLAVVEAGFYTMVIALYVLMAIHVFKK